MAFDYTNLYPDTSGNGGYTKSWNYTTVVDNVAACSASGYFNKVASRLGIGDNIVVAQVDAFDTKNRTTLLDKAVLFVTTISGGVVTTVNGAALVSPAFTGTPTAPTAAPGNNSTQLATTAYADAGLALKANLISPAFTTPDIGTPSAGTATNLTGTAAGLTAGTFSAGSAANLTSGILPNARLNATIKPEGRLTLTTGAPVLTATVSAATSVIYALYAGNLVPIYDGTNMIPTAINELSNVNANSSVGSAGPAAVANSSCYDYFVWSNAGTPTLTRGPAWTNTTTRSAGTALVRVNGIWLNNASITNGPAASRGTYVGTACSNGTATFDWILGGSASGGTAAVLNVWNYYNRVSVSTTVFDTGTGYTYLSATPRQARASAGNQISFVAGLVEDGFPVTMVGQVNTAATAGATAMWGIGLNSTSTFAAGRTFGQAATAVVTVFGSSASANLIPQLGLNVISANEASDGATTNTFCNNSLNNLSTTLRM